MGKRRVYNPYLPAWEFTPDCEPHVFGGRVYVFGSHDSAHGPHYCVGDYVSWSAPVDDLSDWRYEGVVWRRGDDPTNGQLMGYSAPDVCQGPDGRYYLYYFFTEFPLTMGVAVCDEPAGHYSYLGKVCLPSGEVLTADAHFGMPFDPAVYVEGDRAWLYWGFSIRPSDGTGALAGQELPEAFRQGSFVAELGPDMRTMRSDPKPFVPGTSEAAGTSFKEHPFLEASSFRKLGGRYYFVYSSAQGHELCYAICDAPDEAPREFGGVIVSNGDVGMPGVVDEGGAVYYLGNNHGGLVQLGERTYVFYHRHTQGTQCSRQDCAEEVHVAADGSIAQVEITSCGLNDGPLPARGELPAYACCHLRSPEGILHYSSHVTWREPHPFVALEDDVYCPTSSTSYVHNLRDGAEVGYKYLRFDGSERRVSLSCRGGFEGEVRVLLDAPSGPDALELAHVEVVPKERWESFSAELSGSFEGRFALYLVPEGTGSLDLLSVSFS